MKRILLLGLILTLASCWDNNKVMKRPERILTNTDGRAEFSLLLQEQFLKDGYKVTIKAEGDSNEHLIIRGARMNRDFDNRLKDTGLYKQWLEMGYEKIILTNGSYKSVYTVE